MHSSNTVPEETSYLFPESEMCTMQYANYINNFCLRISFFPAIFFNIKVTKCFAQPVFLFIFFELFKERNRHRAFCLSFVCLYLSVNSKVCCKLDIGSYRCSRENDQHAKKKKKIQCKVTDSVMWNLQEIYVVQRMKDCTKIYHFASWCQ